MANDVVFRRINGRVVPLRRSRRNYKRAYSRSARVSSVVKKFGKPALAYGFLAGSGFMFAKAYKDSGPRGRAVMAGAVTAGALTSYELDKLSRNPTKKNIAKFALSGWRKKVLLSIGAGIIGYQLPNGKNDGKKKQVFNGL